MFKAGQLSEHFHRSEWECKCGCGFNTVDGELIRVLEDVRSHFSGLYGRARVSIAGGNRCWKRNGETPGAAINSLHVHGKAADFKVFHLVAGDDWQQVAPDEVALYLERTYPIRYGVGRYNNRTHVDVRPYMARWQV